jgi:hypothetical protein
MGSTRPRVHSGRRVIRHWGIRRIYYHSRKPEAGAESQTSGCVMPQSAPASCIVQSFVSLMISGATQSTPFPRHLSAYLTTVLHVPFFRDTMGEHAHFDQKKSFWQSFLHPLV